MNPSLPLLTHCFSCLGKSLDPFVFVEWVSLFSFFTVCWETYKKGLETKVTKTCTESPHALASALGEPEVEPSPSRPGAVETGTNAPSGMSHS